MHQNAFWDALDAAIRYAVAGHVNNRKCGIQFARAAAYIPAGRIIAKADVGDQARGLEFLGFQPTNRVTAGRDQLNLVAGTLKGVLHFKAEEQFIFDDRNHETCIHGEVSFELG